MVRGSRILEVQLATKFFIASSPLVLFPGKVLVFGKLPFRTFGVHGSEVLYGCIADEKLTCYATYGR
jgi:hypothetical protein